MIENEAQYKLTKKAAKKLADGIKRIEASFDELSEHDKQGATFSIQGVRAKLDELEADLKEYEARTRQS